MNSKLILHILLLLVLPVSSFGQTREKIELNEGVDLYKSGSYKEAREKFERAYSENPNYARALYNAGNSAYLSGNFDTAMIYYNDYANKIQSKNEKAKAYFNVGNAQLQKAKIAASNPENLKDAQAFYQEAIKSYKESLKFNPNDPETKYNLTYALNQLKKNQQQQQQQQQNDKQDKQDKNQDNKDPQDPNGDKGDQGENGDKNQDQENQDQGDKSNEQGDKEQDKNQGDEKDGEGDPKEEKENENGKNGQPGEENEKEPVEGQISRAQAIKDLDAINSDEGKILQKVYQKKGDKKEKTNSGKDW